MNFKHILIAACVCIAAAACQPKGPKEYIVTDTSIPDLGKVKEADGPLSFVMLYKNETNDTIVPFQFRTSCNCTSPGITNMPIAPGEYQRIEVTFKPAYKKGAFEESIDILYRDGKIRSFLFIGEVIPCVHPVTESAKYAMGLDFYSSHLKLSYGHILPGKTADMYFHIGNDSGKNMKVRFELDGEYESSVRMTRELMMRKDQRDTLHVKVTMPELNQDDTLKVKIQPYINDQPTDETITLTALCGEFIDE